MAYRPPAYFEVSKRPLHVLVFVLPLLIIHEISSSRLLSGADGARGSILEAHRLINDLFETFGAIGGHLPAAALVAVLVAWHLVRRDPNRVHPSMLGGMAAEALLWTIPLLVLAPLVGQLAGMTADATETAGLSVWDRFTLSLGAGIYEEFLFRLIGITVVHALLVDLVRVPEGAGTALAVGATAIAFALIHPDSGESWGMTSRRLFFLLAGIYFGVVYVLRGFGITVGVHAAYDLIALILLADGSGGG